MVHLIQPRLNALFTILEYVRISFCCSVPQFILHISLRQCTFTVKPFCISTTVVFYNCIFVYQMVLAPVFIMLRYNLAAPQQNKSYNIMRFLIIESGVDVAQLNVYYNLLSSGQCQCTFYVLQQVIEQSFYLNTTNVRLVFSAQCCYLSETFTVSA